MVCCAICKADKSKKSLKRSFHRFPKDDTLCKLWIEATGRKNLNPKHAVVCSDHFEAKDFNRFGINVLLRKGTIPKRRDGAALYEDQHQVDEPVLILEVTSEENDRIMLVESTDVSGNTFQSLIGVLPEDISVDVAVSNSSVEMREEMNTKSCTDHTYFSIKESPEVKDDCNALNRRNVSLVKQLKISKQKVRRLQKRVETLKTRLKIANTALKRKLLASEDTVILLRETAVRAHKESIEK